MALVTNASSTRAALERTVAEARARGVGVQYEDMTLVVLDLFARYAKVDRANAAELCRMYETWYNDKRYCAVGSSLACRELRDAAAVAAAAEAEIAAMLRDPLAYSRRPIPNRSMLGATVRDGYLYRANTSHIVFPGGFDQGLWKYLDGFPSPETLDSVLALGQGSVEVSASLAQLVPTPNTVNVSYIDAIVGLFDAYYARGISVGLFYRCTAPLPGWMISAYAGLTDMIRGKCSYAVNHPALPDLLRLALSPLVKRLRGHPALHSYRLGNEVWFALVSRAPTCAGLSIEGAAVAREALEYGYSDSLRLAHQYSLSLDLPYCSNSSKTKQSFHLSWCRCTTSGCARSTALLRPSTPHTAPTTAPSTKSRFPGRWSGRSTSS